MLMMNNDKKTHIDESAPANQAVEPKPHTAPLNPRIEDAHRAAGEVADE
jgi:hypothetical protein